MKKLIFLMATAAIALTSCKDPKPEQATLSINAPAEITFNADGTGGMAAITVTTDQAEWNYTLTPADGAGWLTPTKDGNQLKLSAAPNTETTAPASVTITFTAGDAPEKTTTVKQLAAEEVVQPTLTTDAPEVINFNADGTGGMAAITVTTNQDEWGFALVPEGGNGWLTAVKDGNTLSLTAASNTLPVEVEDVVIEFMAGSAPKVSVTAKQNMGEIEMVFVEGGTFSMGNSATNAPDIELPVREVTLSDFYMGKFEVTQALWVAVMANEDGDNNPSNWLGDDLPVEKVLYDQILIFIDKLNQKTGKNYRLPTEAEWEYAARGGKNKDTFLFAGSDNIDEVAWYTANSDGKTHSVGLKAPNSLGLYDMTGNVAEYTSDWWKSGGYVADAPADPNDMTDPQGPPAPAMMTTARKYNRGGNWGTDATITSGIGNTLTNTGRSQQYCTTGVDTGQNYLGLRLVHPAIQ